MVVDWFILEEEDITNLGNQSLFLPGHREASPGIFLCPERVVEIQHDLPPGELMLNWDIWVDFVSMGVPETKEDVVRCESYSQGSSQD